MCSRVTTEGRAVPSLIEGLGLAPHQVCFVGDDLPDLPVLRAVGLAACPADAVAEVKDAAHLITQAPGGRGAVREVVEVILKSQGKWNDLIAVTVELTRIRMNTLTTENTEKRDNIIQCLYYIYLDLVNSVSYIRDFVVEMMWIRDRST